jgi:hypothetical protein
MKSALAFSCVSWLNITDVARTINTGNSYKEYRDDVMLLLLLLLLLLLRVMMAVFYG